MKQVVRPEVSYVIAAYNAADFVEKAIRSALVQESVAVEVIAIDDASQDATAEIITEIARSDNRIRLITRPNGGASAARNSGLKAARGDWIAILDADDIIEPDRSTNLVRLAKEYKSDIICDNLMRFFDEDGSISWPLLKMTTNTNITHIEIAEYLRRNKMLKGDDNLGYLKPIIRRDFLMRHNLFYDETLRTGEDFDLCMRCFANGAKYTLVSKPYYNYRVNRRSLSGQICRKDIESLIQAHDKLIPTFKSPSKEIQHAALGYRRSLVRALLFIDFRQNIKSKDYRQLLNQIINVNLIKIVCYLIIGLLKRRTKQFSARTQRLNL